MDFKKILNDEELKQKDKLIEQIQLDQKEKLLTKLIENIHL